MSILQEEISRKLKFLKQNKKKPEKRRIIKLGSVTHHSTPKKPSNRKQTAG
jgi:hypothetical protein